jgi:hypothetical protein
VSVPARTFRVASARLRRSAAAQASTAPLAVLAATGGAFRRSQAARDPGLSRLLRSRPGVTALVATLLLVVVGFGAFLTLRRVRADDDYLFYTQSTSPVRPFGVSLPPALRTWTFSSLPRGWQLAPEQSPRVQPDGARLDVVTGTGRFDYQLLSPVQRLPAGRYLAVARGRVRRGGLELGVLGVENNSWINVLNFWDGQSVNRQVTMTVPFALKRRRAVRIILANYAKRAESSRWQLFDVSFRRVGSGGTSPARRLASSCADLVAARRGNPSPVTAARQAVRPRRG